jgi:hypothetical protein
MTAEPILEPEDAGPSEHEADDLSLAWDVDGYYKEHAPEVGATGDAPLAAAAVCRQCGETLTLFEVEAGDRCADCIRHPEPLVRNVTPTVEQPPTPLSKRIWSPSDIPDELGLELVEQAFGKLLVVPDTRALRVTLGAVVANYAPGDPVNLVVVAPPSTGKTEHVTAIADAPDVWSLSSLTPQTLLSGFERKRKDGPPASLLLQIGEFGILAFKDLTTVLTMHREARAQIIGQLREVADGKTEKAFGNGLKIDWQGKVALIAGVTPIIDEQHAFLAVMGERFVLYRLPEASRQDSARRAIGLGGQEKELRAEIRALVAAFLRQFRHVGQLPLPDDFVNPLISLADIVTRARTGVARDYQSRDVLYLPEPEAPARLAKQLAQLARGLLAIGVEEDDALDLVRKVGWDCVPAVRTTVMAALARRGGLSATRAELEEETDLPSSTVRRVEEDLGLLGLVDRTKDSSGKWIVAERDLVREYAGTRPESAA